MKYYTYILIALLTSLTCGTKAQTKTSGTVASLDSLFARIVRSRDDVRKVQLNDSIRTIIDGYVLSDSVMSHRFSTIRYLGQISSSDASLKIINWNLALRDGSNRYFCYVIRKGEKGKTNKIYRFNGTDSEEAPATDKIYSLADWYGGIYYAVQPFKRDGKIHYLVLGLNNNNVYVTRKIIDVISFGKNDDIEFGSPCFFRNKSEASRVVFEYSGEAVVSLRMLNPKTVIFDRLASHAGNNAKSADTMGAEYRFDGFTFKKGSWSFITNVDARNDKYVKKTNHKIITSPY
jgi:hypothetical protein